MLGKKMETKQIGQKMSISELWSKFGVLFLLIVLCTVLSLMRDTFLTWSNIINVLRQTAITGVIAVGQFFLIIAACFDMSAGSVVALTGVTIAFLLKNCAWPIWATVIVGLVIGAAAGLINGYCVTKRKIPAFIATLGMMNVARGLAYIITEGHPISSLPDAFQFFGRGYAGPIPIPVIVLTVVFVLAAILAARTPFGRNLYAIGGNTETAKLSGINTDRTLIKAFVLSGLMAALSGLMLTSRLASGDPSTGEGFEFSAITAVVLGGTSIYGGEGSIRGVIVGTIFMGVLSNGMNMIGVSSYLQLVMKGLVLVLAVGIDTALKRD